MQVDTNRKAHNKLRDSMAEKVQELAEVKLRFKRQKHAILYFIFLVLLRTKIENSIHYTKLYSINLFSEIRLCFHAHHISRLEQSESDRKMALDTVRTPVVVCTSSCCTYSLLARLDQPYIIETVFV